MTQRLINSNTAFLKEVNQKHAMCLSIFVRTKKAQNSFSVIPAQLVYQFLQPL